jgi:steroid delta-isomerase-like uncharacterized protein
MGDLKALTQSFIDEISSGTDIDAAVDRYLAEDFVEHEDVPGMDNTRETPRVLFKMMHAAFPDFHIDVQDLIEDGDKVAARFTMGGTHSGEFMGMPASGNVVTIDVIDIFQFRGDQAVAHWGLMDTPGMMEQMGAGPG